MMRYLLVCVGMLWILGVHAQKNGDYVTVRGDTTIVEKLPRFQGGDINNFRRWAASRIEYPERAVMDSIIGKVLVRFIINEDGTMSDVELLQSPHDELARVALKAVLASPRWEPGMQGPATLGDGTVVAEAVPVRVRMVVPFAFRMRDTDDLDAAPHTFYGDITAYEQVEIPPRYKGRAAGAFGGELLAKVKIPKKLAAAGYDGIVGVGFVVEPNGSLSNIEFTNVDKSLENEVMRFMKRAPRWMPGADKYGNPLRTGLVMQLKLKAE